MQLLKHFHELSLQSKNAKELKGLILQLAIEGNLTKKWRIENPNSETQLALLKRIKVEKATLLIENEVKKEKPIDPISKSEIKFELPIGWVWCRFSEIAYIVRGGSPRPIKDYITTDPEGLNWIKIGDTKGNPKYIEKCQEKIIKEGLKKSRLVIPGDFLLSNSMSFGRPYIMKTTGCIHDGWLLIREAKKIIGQDYLYHMLSSKYIYNSFKESAAGGVVQNLNIEKAKQTVIPIPPIKEQIAIVKIVEQLFKEVEQLEHLTVKRIQLKEQFAASALRDLSTNNTIKEWEVLKPHFHTFFNEEPNIKKLRESILQLALQGKLTAHWRRMQQNKFPLGEMSEGQRGEGDHSAKALIEKIKAEKAKLVKEGKIKKEKPLPPIKEDEIPYELPEGWVWCRFQEVFDIRDGTHDSPKYVEGGDSYPLITSKDFKNGAIDFSNSKRISKGDYLKIIQRSGVETDDVLFSMIGGNIGNQVVVGEFIDFAIKNVALFKYFNKKLSVPQFLKLFSLHITYDLQNKAIGGAQPFISLTNLRNLLFPVPSLEEQKAIVETVNHLMVSCDQLEEQAKLSKQQAGDWMKGSLREVIQKKKHN
jgi:type I restriction enzyme, S subunit